MAQLMGSSRATDDRVEVPAAEEISGSAGQVPKGKSFLASGRCGPLHVGYECGRAAPQKYIAPSPLLHGFVLLLTDRGHVVAREARLECLKVRLEVLQSGCDIGKFRRCRVEGSKNPGSVWRRQARFKSWPHRAKLT
jgi:hypothetical protein